MIIMRIGSNYVLLTKDCIQNSSIHFHSKYIKKV